MTTTRRAFECPAATVFGVLIDPDTYPHWLVGAKTIRSVDPTWPQPSSKFHHVVGFGPIAIPDSSTSLAVEPDRMLELLVKARPALEARVRFDLADTADGCVLTMTETPVGPFRLIAPIVSPLITMRNERSMDRLAGVVEGRHAGT